jgi:hypothetical protein
MIGKAKGVEPLAWMKSEILTAAQNLQGHHVTLSRTTIDK